MSALLSNRSTSLQYVLGLVIAFAGNAYAQSAPRPTLVAQSSTCATDNSTFTRPTRTTATGFVQNLDDYNQNLLVRRRPIANLLLKNLINYNAQSQVASIRIGTGLDADNAIWKSEHEKILSNIAAALHAVKEVKLGLVCNDGSVYDKTAIDTFMSKRDGVYAIASAVENFTAGIYKTSIAGTSMDPNHGGGDYDFVMREMISLLFTFKSDDDLLTTVATDRIVINGLSSYMGVSIDSFKQKLVAEIKVGSLGLTAPETENHVLMTLSSQYLTNQWVLTNPRTSSGLKDLQRYTNADSALEDFLLSAAGRIAQLGPWETNGRTYQVYSFHALNNLASFADNKLLQIGAQNAMDTMTAMYAAQSINGKRMAPYRRSYHYMAGLGLYENDGFSISMGLLSGAYSWPDSLFLDGNVLNSARVGLWNTLLSYRLHSSVHDLMANRHLRSTGMWSRMMTRFSPEHYEGGRAALYADNGAIYEAAPYERTPQYYLITPSIMNSAGGRYSRYAIKGDTTKEFATAFTEPMSEFNYKDPTAYGKLVSDMATKMADDVMNGNPVPKDSDFLSRPQTVLPFGHVPNWSRSDNASTERGHLTKYVPALFGNPDRYWMAENDATFKGFSYGYQYYGSNQWDALNDLVGETGTDRHLRFPMSFPAEWTAYRYNENDVYEFAPDNNQHARARFVFYDLRNAPVNKDDPIASTWGVLLVLGRVSKDSPDTKYRSYARGFWEVVPGSRFATVADLKQYVMKYNPSDNYPNKTSDGRHYRYVMSTGETVEMESLIGYKDNDNDCMRNPIMKIWSAGKDWRKDKEDDRNQHLFNACDDSKQGTTYLMVVDEVDQHMVYTKTSAGTRNTLMQSNSAFLQVRNFYINSQLFNNSAVYKQPACSETAGTERPLRLCNSIPLIK